MRRAAKKDGGLIMKREIILTTEFDRAEAERLCGIGGDHYFPPDCDSGKCRKCRRCYSEYVEEKLAGELDG